MTSAAGTPEPSATGPDVCSAKGCADTARWGLLWNNPRLHTPDRRKTWLACEEHRESLSSFLGSKGFLRDVVDADQVPSA